MRSALLTLFVLLTAGATAHAQAPGGPIPEEPGADSPEFIGSAATPRPVYMPSVPRHPSMAPNGRSNIHADAFMTDTNVFAGPLGRETETASTFQSSDCASVTFDSKGRIVTICVGIQRPRLKLFDPRTLEELATMDLPPRDLTGVARLFTDFSGGGYFYLDSQDRAIVPTNDRHLYVVSHATGQFVIEKDYDLTSAVDSDDKMISVLPDWNGLIWFASTDGVVGTVEPETGRIKSTDLGEDNQNSFTVGDRGEVYIVTTKALYRMFAGADGTPQTGWRKEYENTGELKPGQASAGSGTTPTLMGRWVAITDNADPMNVVVYRRSDGGQICRRSVFEKGASATDNSLIGAGNSIVVENNYGYEGPQSTLQGARTTPGVERIDIDRDGTGCRTVWKSDETSPTVVPKLSLPNGLVYVYTQGEAGDNDDPWYLTALDFWTGKTVWKRLVGHGFGFNNNYAPVTIGPDGTAYVGVLGGLTLVRDRKAPSQTAPTTPRLRVTVRPRSIRARRRTILRFRVTAHSGGIVAPVRDAHVRVGKRAGTTGRAGRTKVRVLAGRRTKRYAVRVTKSGYRTGHAKVKVRR